MAHSAWAGLDDCRKLGFPSKAAAKRSIGSRKGWMTVYQCGRCGQWHQTRKRNAKYSAWVYRQALEAVRRGENDALRYRVPGGGPDRAVDD